MSGKGDRRRAGDTQAFRDNHERIFSASEEDSSTRCPTCGQIELRPQANNPPMWECNNCKTEVQF